jgi:hypothetical protein
MARLSDVASFVKSANAGATMLTFDIGFASRDAFDRVVASGSITPQSIMGLYGVRAGEVAIYAYAPALMVKITIPRPVMSGGVAERDFDGVQQFAPLLDLDVPL